MNVDAIYVINLKKDSHRKKLIKRNFPDVQISWYTAKPNPNGGDWGCYESHRNVIEMARRKGQKRILIMPLWIL